MRNPIFIKTLITEQCEILLIYADPEKKNDNKVSVTKLSDKAATPQILVQTLALSNEYARFFRDHEPALLVDDTIYFNKPMIYVNDVNEILSATRLTQHNTKNANSQLDLNQW